jgi:SAM-dependent methyltransferase
MRLARALFERLRLARSWLQSAGDNRRFRAANPEFATPPPALAFDAYAHTNWPGYVRHGQEHADLIASKVRTFHTGSGARAERPVILDWGCGPGRVVRQLAERLRPLRPEIYATDYNPKTIQWCRDHLPNIHFLRNEASPPMPFEDGQFDVVYGISVFTHLSEKLHTAWRDELARILAPGGLLILTLHGERFLQHLDPESVANPLRDEIVVFENAQEGKRQFQAYHPKGWVRRHFDALFSCEEHDERELFDWFHQDVWVLRKRPAGSDRS